MKELVVVSGKGGTGKTSIVASLAVLARPVVAVDCDVDAANLHLLLDPMIERRETFIGGGKATIVPDRCASTGRCQGLCRFGAVRRGDPTDAGGRRPYYIDRLSCEGCGVCARFCPHGAIDFAPAPSGEWFISHTRCGPMVHARLHVGGENSGKLVTLIRAEGKRITRQSGQNLMIVDGSPGIGCPVIASLTDCDLALFVVESTIAGLHDFRRISELARKLRISGVVIINKADLNETVTEEIGRTAARWGIPVVGRIPYDTAITAAQKARKAVVEISDGPAATAIRTAWAELNNHLTA